MTNCQDYDFDSTPPWRPKDKYRATAGDAVVERVGGSDEFPAYSYGFRWNLSEMVEDFKASQESLRELVDKQMLETLANTQARMFMDVCDETKDETERDGNDEFQAYSHGLEWLKEAPAKPGSLLARMKEVHERMFMDVMDVSDDHNITAPKPHSLDAVLALHERLCEEARELVAKKGADYNRSQQANGDTLANLKAAYQLGLVESPAQGVIIRLLDKVMRLASLCKPGEKPANTEESIEDTVKDIINYSNYIPLLVKHHEA